jgi:hypothetical protein
VALRQRRGLRGSVLLLCLAAGGCATPPAPAAPQPAATSRPAPLVFRCGECLMTVDLGGEPAQLPFTFAVDDAGRAISE